MLVVKNSETAFYACVHIKWPRIVFWFVDHSAINTAQHYYTEDGCVFFVVQVTTDESLQLFYFASIYLSSTKLQK